MHLDSVLAAAVGDGLYDGIETGYVTSAGKDADALYRHDHPSTFQRPNGAACATPLGGRGPAILD